MRIRILFVDDEPNIIMGLRRVLFEMRDEWDLSFVESGEAALRILAEQSFDVIVTDMRMPGMDGAQLINKVAELYPQTIRFILSGYSDRNLVYQSMGSVHQFLAKPCDIEQLKQVIRRACQLRDILKDDHLRQFVTGTTTLPSLPATYQALIREMENPEVSLQRIGELVAQDVALTAKVLQIVNSAFFILPHKVSSPQQAVTFLGIDVLKGLVLYAHIFDLTILLNARFFPVKTLWKHGIMVGNLAKKIAEEATQNKDIINAALVGGMLHDIGKLILAKNYSEQYLQVQKHANQEDSLIHESEYKVFGTSHAEIGAYLLGLWGNHDSVVSSVLFHHQPSLADENKFSALTAVHVANILIKQKANSPVLSELKELDFDYLQHVGFYDNLNYWVTLQRKSTAGEI